MKTVNIISSLTICSKSNELTEYTSIVPDRYNSTSVPFYGSLIASGDSTTEVIVPLIHTAE